MALDRQVELAMDAMQASHDAMMGHMALVREATRLAAEPAEPAEQLAGDIQMMPGAQYPWQVRRSPEETAKLKTHTTLQKALGGGGAKVLPITPEEKE